MRLALAALFVALSGEVGATSLDETPCPFADDLISHRAACSRFDREDDGTRIAFDIAILTPRARRSIGHVLYIPGGPGEAPVTEDGLYTDILLPFANRTIVLFNPRGTEGTAPRLECDFGAKIWDEDFGGEEERAVLNGCIERIARDGPDPARFTSLEIAEDIDALIRALGIQKAGLYGISYGTEAGLHLLAQELSWLEFVILDSVSVPGLSGVADEIVARDRFLAALNRMCFAQRECSPYARVVGDTLHDWAAEFDADPLPLHPVEGVDWTYDGTEMLDYLAQYGAYRDGLALAVSVIDMLATGRLGALAWMKADAVSNTEFTRDSLPLMLQAYADTFDPQDFETIQSPTRYARDIDIAADLLEFYRLWRGEQPREAMLLNGARQPVGVPALILSGGIDPFTPVEWAEALHARFTGLQHYIYPLLGHAVSIDAGGVNTRTPMGTQMHCASGSVRAFLDPTLKPDRPCEAYEAKGTQ